MKILIADHHPADRALLRAMLEAAGHGVIEAGDGREALGLLDERGVDAIFADVVMPNMDGHQLCQAVRRSARWGGLPFIFHTAACLSPDDTQLAHELGADAFLKKPATAAELAAALASIAKPAERPVPKPAGGGEPDVPGTYGEHLVAMLEKSNLALAARVGSLVRTEQQLRLQATATESTTSAVVITDRSATILWINPAFTAMTGYAPADAVGQNPRLLKSGRHDAAFYKGMWRTLAAGETWRGELINRRKNGSLYYVEQTITPVRSAGGATTHYVAIMNDVSARRQAEEELRVSEARHRSLFENMLNGFAHCQMLFEDGRPVDFIYLAVNRAFTALTGLKNVEGRLVSEVIPGIRETDPQLFEVYARVARTGVPESCETYVSALGQWFEISVYRTDPGQFVAVFDVVTKRKQSEEALRESEIRFRQLVEHITTVFWILEPVTLKILYISPAYAKIWGRPCESLQTHPLGWLEAVCEEDRARVKAVVVDRPVTERYDHTYRITRPDGTLRWIHDRGFPVHDAAGRVCRVVGIAEDITEHRQLEKQLHQAQKMEAVGTLAGGIAHDFNNILGAISGYTELAKLEAVADPKITGYLDAVLEGAHRAVELVRQILTFSSQQDQERKPIRLHHVVNEALRLLRATIPSTIEFAGSIAADTPSVLADATQIHQIMINLGTNAAHAMRNRPGRLTVNLETFHADQIFAEAHTGFRPGSYVRLSVSDTGHGMDEVTMARIFEPFFTTKAPGEGTGLGLAVVHGIMQSHDGIITVLSRPGEGTAFQLHFPAHADQAVAVAAGPKPAPPGHGERILFVDDEPSLALLGKKILERLGYAVDAHTHPVEALEAARAHPGAYDLVITDQMMPRLMGTTLAGQLHAAYPDLPIILVTGYSATLSSEKIHSLGIRKTILKPISVDTLAQAVHAVLVEKDSG